MSRDEKKGFALLFFVIPKKTTNSLVDVRATKPYKRCKKWLNAGALVGLLFVFYYSGVSRNLIKYLAEPRTNTMPPFVARGTVSSNSVTLPPVTMKHVSPAKHPVASPDDVTNAGLDNDTSLEVRHIGFLKVHKAGGSTVENILFRFGLERNLSFVLPDEGYKFTTYLDPELPPLVKPNNNDILAIHSVFDPMAYSAVLNRDAVYIAIVREPLSLFISAAFYHRDVWPVTYLLSVPESNYIQNLIRFPELYDKEKTSYTRNSMALDFGFPNDFHVTDTERIREYIQAVDEQFLFVMIMEYFDESLIYLRKLLNWSLKDVLYIPVNGYKHQSVSVSKVDKRKFKDRNFLDVAIYEYFKEAFMRKLANVSLNFFAEVKHFKVVRGTVERFCSEGVKVAHSITIEASEWNSQFSVTSTDCSNMILSELAFVDQLRDAMKTSGSPSGSIYSQ